MSLIASVTDGQLATTETTSTTETSSSSNSALGKNDFLQLLVAQMQYQDPLEPTSNTEYISQYATFSELEEMQNMSSTMELSRASTLVGKEVVIQSLSTETGTTSYVRGNVDYVQTENGTALLSVNDSLYSLDDVYSIADSVYLNAYDTATQFKTTLDSLPAVATTTLDNEDTINELNEIYAAMSDYEKSFVSLEDSTLLQSYVDKVSELNLGVQDEE